MNVKPDQIAFITINPNGPFLKSIYAGFEENGILPRYLISVSPKDRLMREWKKYRLGLITNVIGPKLRANRSAAPVTVDTQSHEPLQTKPEFTVIKVPKLNHNKTLQILKDLNIKYLVNAGAGIIGARMVNIPGLFIVNAHAGHLPTYRNMNVVEWAIYKDDPVIGTVYRIDKGIDTGEIWQQKELDLSLAKSVDDARRIAFDQVARMVAPAIITHSNGEIQERQQDRAEGKNWYVMHSYFKNIVDEKLEKSEGYPLRGTDTIGDI